MDKRELKKSELKISKNAQKAVALLKDLEASLEKYDKLDDKLTIKEKNLLGGLVMAIYSPLGEQGFSAIVAHDVVATGLVDNIKMELKGLKEQGRMAGALSALKDIKGVLPTPPGLEDIMKKEKKKVLN